MLYQYAVELRFASHKKGTAPSRAGHVLEVSGHVFLLLSGLLCFTSAGAGGIRMYAFPSGELTLAQRIPSHEPHVEKVAVQVRGGLSRAPNSVDSIKLGHLTCSLATSDLHLHPQVHSVTSSAPSHQTINSTISTLFAYISSCLLLFTNL